MTDERRIENVINITEAVWTLNRTKVLNELGRAAGQEIPAECEKLVEWAFRFGASYMERALGKGRKNVQMQ